MGMADRIVYFAYGSNLNKEQMRRRCKTAVPVGRGVLRDVTLAFRSGARGFGRPGVANIEPCPGGVVPVGIWLITKWDLTALDRYEGYPFFYDRHVVKVETDQGYLLEGLVYMMTEAGFMSEPSRTYLDTIRQGYVDFGLDPEPLEKAVERAAKAAESWRKGLGAALRLVDAAKELKEIIDSN